MLYITQVSPGYRTLQTLPGFSEREMNNAYQSGADSLTLVINKQAQPVKAQETISQLMESVRPRSCLQLPSVRVRFVVVNLFALLYWAHECKQ